MFPADKKPQPQVFFFDADTAARVINIAPYPYKLMFLIAAVCGLRIGEVTALKVASIDFKRKLLRVTGALDYATRKESTPKSGNSATPVHMSELLAKHLRDWLDKHYKPNHDGYLFTNSKDKPYLSDNVVKYGIRLHRSRGAFPLPCGKHLNPKKGSIAKLRGALGSTGAFDNSIIYVTIEEMVEIREYHNRGGQSPFREWYDRLNAEAARKVATALYRVGLGNFSNAKSVGTGVYECKINFGPGYRVYFGKEGEQIVILLGGGTKRRQQNDIKLALERWEDYKQRKKRQKEKEGE